MVLESTFSWKLLRKPYIWPKNAHTISRVNRKQSGTFWTIVNIFLTYATTVTCVRFTPWPYYMPLYSIWKKTLYESVRCDIIKLYCTRISMFVLRVCLDNSINVWQSLNSPCPLHSKRSRVCSIGYVIYSSIQPWTDSLQENI